VDVGGTFSDLFLVDDGDHREWRVKTPSTPSDPSQGVADVLSIAARAGYPTVLTFDLGGTSTDVSLCQAGEPTIGREPTIGQFRIKLPSVDVHTVAAGGGSIAHVPELTGALRVPQSAGAEPGPAAYPPDGEDPTVTDANAVLGHLRADLIGGRAHEQALADIEGRYGDVGGVEEVIAAIERTAR
jgi:N-methylhydantoinase A